MKYALDIQNLSYTEGNHKILSNINFKVKKGEFYTILGPNGSGKTSIINAITGLIKTSGEIKIDNQDLEIFKNLKLKAKKIAFVHQKKDAIKGIAVFSFLLLGREPYKGFLGTPNKKDIEIVEKTAKECDIYHLLEHDISTLSGGELQRVFIAGAIIQSTDILILDEPTNHLDIKYRFEILELIKKMNKKHNKTIIMVMHDINLACQYSDRLLMLKNGQKLAEGTCEEVITNKVITNAYDVKSTVTKHNGWINVKFGY